MVANEEISAAGHTWNRNQFAETESWWEIPPENFSIRRSPGKNQRLSGMVSPPTAGPV